MTAATLNPAQREAVRYLDGPCLVIAGAGSGKTRVIIHKIGHLIESGVPAERIGAITFTNKAASEMAERMKALVRLPAGRAPLVSTFHSLGVQMLRADGILGVDELHIVYTEFRSLLAQIPVAKRMAPLEVEEVEEFDYEREDRETGAGAGTGDSGVPTSYEFEPSPDALLDALLPKYVTTRIFAAMLESAASESASRRRAMKSASDNAEELAKNLSRQANQARQAEITQEISEIVGGADALVSAGADD